MALLSIQMYMLAIVISLLVAVVIRGVVITLSRLGNKSSVVTMAKLDSIAANRSDEDHIAAVTAAVWAVVGPYRIVHIEPTDRGRVWATESLFTHHTSHAVGHHPKRWESKPK
uniref:Oxaloacetate decarboxylase, gamma chain n=1 Tax=Candidatus Kentrum sp. TC TaxID=2126339 RepID=A0A450Z9L1_9GAMM|nr:MAG: hypothetical protein BECKTC1821E_GA0114239_10996 [Candidatus Kentron sp. TC]VFK50480.1 MAG: hypothetical protein BECKTC1821D_GA0114238_11056 [Candidatus Kentron sp. TC]VFK63446.1 MAG: hypothetical protein BECKTC1821F_GA0114240_10955 [Candidatus Kentron sp. TC]